MKKLLLVGFTILGFSSLTNAQTDRCGTMQHHEYLQSIDPGYSDRQAAIDELILNSIKNDPSFRITNTVTIPVVVHVLYSTNNATQNISTARINAQIARLNADYSATNTDITSVPSVFQSVIGNPAIQFCLAQQDPNGVATDGIIRKQTTVTSWSTNDNIKRTANGGDDAWPNTKYLNLWIGNLGSGLLGYAQFPGGSAATDGVVLLNGSVGGPGATGTSTPYHLGRTATHEIGHWLNLRHINGDASCGNDYVADTPAQSALNFGCPTFPHVTCSNGPNGDMFMNYMDYTDDACMYMFSAGQGTRMNAAINSSRAALLTSPGCTPVGLFEPASLGIFVHPVPTSGILTIENSFNNGESADVRVLNMVGQTVLSNKITDFSGSNQLDISSLRDGIYMLEITSNKKTSAQRIVLSR